MKKREEAIDTAIINYKIPDCALLINEFIGEREWWIVRKWMAEKEAGRDGEVEI